MATIVTDSKNYSDIAAAIRDKLGENKNFKPAEMAAAIEAIKTGAENVVEFTAPKGRMKGDFDGDGYITQSDVDGVNAHTKTNGADIADPVQFWCADIHNDNSVNAKDLLVLRRNVAGTGNVLVTAFDVGINPDYYNNWTFYKIDSLSGYFYYDVPVSGITANSSALLLASNYADCFIGVECMEGIARVKAERLPLAETDCLIVWEADGTKWKITKETAKGVFPNGTEWTQSNIKSGNFAYMYNANGIWVACGSTGLYYSTNGKMWTQSNITSGTFNRTYNANGIWVASGSVGLYYSTDGKVWTQSNITSGNFMSIYNANGMWVVGSNSGLYYSTDGMTWAQSNITSGNFLPPVYNANGIWVACSFGNGMQYSTDGITWYGCNNSPSVATDLYYANGLWVCAGAMFYSVGYSTDGINWTQSNLPIGTYNAVYYANGIWVATSTTGLYYSTDGKSWTQSNNTTDLFYYLDNGNGIFVVCSKTGLYYSTDGKTWVQSNIVSGTFNRPYNADGIWVAGGENGLYYSVGWET